MKKIWYVLVSGLMLFAACGSDDDEPTKKGDKDQAYNVQSIVCSYPSETTGEMVESLILSYEYKDGKVAKIVIDMVDYMKQEVSFEYTSSTEANYVVKDDKGATQMTGKACFDANTNVLTKIASDDSETALTYDENKQLISEKTVYDGGSNTIEYVWGNGNLLAADVCAIEYSDIKNNTNFDFGMMFSSDFPQGTSISQLVGTVSANVPSEITDDEETITIETQLDAKNRPVSLVLSSDAVMTITYCE